jgi:hypothetical protein
MRVVLINLARINVRFILKLNELFLLIISTIWLQK